MPGYSAKPLSLSLSHCCRFCLSSSSFSSTSIFLSLHWRSSYLSWELGTFTPTGDHWWGCEGVRVWGCDCEDQCKDVWGRVPHKHYMCTYMCLHSSVTMVTVIHCPPPPGFCDHGNDAEGTVWWHQASLERQGGQLTEVLQTYPPRFVVYKEDTSSCAGVNQQCCCYGRSVPYLLSFCRDSGCN